jgi:hypothetical protein
VVRQRSAKPSSPVQIWVPPPKQVLKFVAEVAELADARDLKSLGPKDRTGSIPVFGTNYYKGLSDLKKSFKLFYLLIYCNFTATMMKNQKSNAEVDR